MVLILSMGDTGRFPLSVRVFRGLITNLIIIMITFLSVNCGLPVNVNAFVFLFKFRLVGKKRNMDTVRVPFSCPLSDGRQRVPNIYLRLMKNIPKNPFKRFVFVYFIDFCSPTESQTWRSRKSSNWISTANHSVLKWNLFM